jgi:hypothetical protein
MQIESGFVSTIRVSSVAVCGLLLLLKSESTLRVMAKAGLTLFFVAGLIVALLQKNSPDNLLLT